ncbi:unnamed protein product, partial [Amoebophrya sp. A25]
IFPNRAVVGLTARSRSHSIDSSRTVSKSTPSDSNERASEFEKGKKEKLDGVDDEQASPVKTSEQNKILITSSSDTPQKPAVSTWLYF